MTKSAIYTTHVFVNKHICHLIWTLSIIGSELCWRQLPLRNKVLDWSGLCPNERASGRVSWYVPPEKQAWVIKQQGKEGVNHKQQLGEGTVVVVVVRALLFVKGGKCINKTDENIVLD